MMNNDDDGGNDDDDDYLVYRCVFSLALLASEACEASTIFQRACGAGG